VSPGARFEWCLWDGMTADKYAQRRDKTVYFRENALVKDDSMFNHRWSKAEPALKAVSITVADDWDETNRGHTFALQKSGTVKAWKGGEWEDVGMGKNLCWEKNVMAFEEAVAGEDDEDERSSNAKGKDQTPADKVTLDHTRQTAAALEAMSKKEAAANERVEEALSEKQGEYDSIADEAAVEDDGSENF